MAHFAEIVEGVVTRVIVVANSDCLDDAGQESEAVGAAFCHRLLGGTWVQTSYSGSRRGGFAGVGYRYDPALDMFVAPD